MSAAEQKDVFHALIEDTLGEDCSYETVRTIHENLNEMMEEHQDEPDPLALDKDEVRYLFEKSGVAEEKLENFDDSFANTAGENTTLLATNVVNTKKFEIKTPDIVIQVNPERTDLVETRIIDGRQCLVIAVDDHVEINGINARTMKPKAARATISEETDGDTEL